MQSYKSKIKKRFQVINSLKDLMEQGFRYEKNCLSKKERTTCIGNGNSGENPKGFNGKNAFFTHLQRLNATLQCHDVSPQCHIVNSQSRDVKLQFLDVSLQYHYVSFPPFHDQGFSSRNQARHLSPRNNFRLFKTSCAITYK